MPQRSWAEKILAEDTAVPPRRSVARRAYCACFYYPCEHGTTLEEHALASARSSVGFCRDCKWWRSPTKYSGTDGWGDCLRLVQSQVGYLAIADDEYGPIQTSPEFGCVQFEAKTDA